MGNMSNGSRVKLESNLIDLRMLIEQMIKFNEQSERSYSDAMQKSINQIQTYFNETEFMQLHQTTKNNSMNQVHLKSFIVNLFFWKNFFPIEKKPQRKFHTKKRFF